MMPFNTENTPLNALCGSSPIIWVIEYEVERHWSAINPGDIMGPQLSPKGDRSVVASMEELALLTSRNQDYLMFRHAPDRSFLNYLQARGLGRGAILTVQQDNPQQDICQLILADSQLMQKLDEIRKHNPDVRFQFYGATSGADLLVRQTGIPSLSADSTVTARVNSKTYSSLLDFGFKRIPYGIARCRDEIRSIAESLNSEIILKDPMGVSGKGLKIIHNKSELDLYLKYLERRNLSPKELVIEKYIPKISDYNYQFFVSKSGVTTYYSYKEALLDGQKHLGHFTACPASHEIRSAFDSAAQEIGKKLYREGYFGWVGVDAVLAKDGTLFPLLEINARLNNSSFQWCLDQVGLMEKCLIVSQELVTLAASISFEVMEHELQSMKSKYRNGEDIMIVNWGAMSRLNSFPTKSRIPYAVMAGSHDRCLYLQELFKKAVRTLTC